MADGLISVDVLKSRVLQGQFKIGQDGTWYVLGLIDSTPTIEAEPVRHGRWKQIVHPWFECSECGERTAVVNLNGEVVWNYCPNCGAKMDEVEE